MSDLLPDGGHPGAGLRGQRRDARRLERRAGLLEAAVGEIRRSGPGVTMEQLARAGGVTKPILYRHFRDREGLVSAIAEQFSSALMAEIETALAATSDPRGLLETTIGTYVAYIDRDQNVYRFLMQSIGRGRRTDAITSLADNIGQRVAVVVGDQLRAVGRDTGAAVPWAYGIVGMVHQSAGWWIDDRSMSRDRLVGYLCNLLWEGMAAGAPIPEAATDH